MAALMRLQRWWRVAWPALQEWRASRPKPVPIHLQHLAASKIQAAWQARKADPLRAAAPELRLRAVVRIRMFVARWRARRRMKAYKASKAAALIQAAIRGRMARKVVQRLRAKVTIRHNAVRAALLVQTQWRGFNVRRKYAILRVMALAAVDIQRMVRGWMARLESRKRRWLETLPGEERISRALDTAEEYRRRYKTSITNIALLQQQIEAERIAVRKFERVVKSSQHEAEEAAAKLKEAEQVSTNAAWRRL